MMEEGAFVEWAEVYHDLYGTSTASVRGQTEQGLDVVMDLDSQGAGNIKEKMKESTLIYILPPSLEILERRLRDRATDEEGAISRRIMKARKEIKNCLWYDYLVINDKLDQAAREVASIIVSGRCRPSRMRSRVKEILGQ